MVPRVRVLYIAGWGRSGTTILGNVLGQIDGVTAVGELQHFWERNLAGRYRCGCGKDVAECAFWSEVLHLGWGAQGPPVRQMIEWQRRLRTRHLPLFALPGAAERSANGLEPYLAQLNVLYRSIAEVGGAEIVVDSSKAPAYGFALSLIPDVELSVLLMVRDPRGVACSWLRPKADPGRAGGYMKRFGAISSSVLWLTWNGATERLLEGRAARFAVLRYEDFARDPETSVGRIVSWLDLGPRDLPFDGPRTVVLAPTHTTSGNPDRERTGPVPIRLDQRWRTELPAWRRALVTALTWPMLARYGYVTASAGGGTAR